MLGVPVRIAKPENLVGMIDQLASPAYATSVGLLRWGMLYSEVLPEIGKAKRQKTQSKREGGGTDWEWLKDFFRRLLP
jgi:cell division protein FtsA